MTDIESYLQSKSNMPYFLVVGDSGYVTAKTELSAKGLTFIHTSDYCPKPNKRPNLDDLFSYLETADVSVTDNKIAVLGLGEYLALTGDGNAKGKLAELKSKAVGNAKIVLLLRGVADIVRGMQESDRTRFDNRRVSFYGDCRTDISVAFLSDKIAMPAKNGIQALLRAIEDDESVTFTAKTAISELFANSLIPIMRIEDAYDGVNHILRNFALSSACGTNEQWSDLLSSLSEANGNLDAVFDLNGISSNIEDDWNDYIKDTAFKNWLYFIALKTKADTLGNSYLCYVLARTENFADFKRSVLNAIITVSHTDNRFNRFYNERKHLIEKFTEPDVAAFVMDNREDTIESFYKLTDQTRAEREEIIAFWSNIDPKKASERIKMVYPALSDYLFPYTFTKCGDLDSLLTQYFTDYRRQKLKNKMEDDFAAQVLDLAKKRVYSHLPSRDEIFNAISTTDTYLYWLDALGVEFLGFIQKQCERLGLSFSARIARADLPTITSLNKDFYINWQEPHHANSDKRLDNIKHKADSGYNYQDNKLPIHLAEEIHIIADVLSRMATELHLRRYKKVILSSDHGASRLAVIKEQEEKYETDTKGEHGGRCCKIDEEWDLPNAAKGNDKKGNDYYVLADYGRFKKSRAANVEVHGGASLEEVIVPIIELTLRNPDVEVRLVEPQEIIATYKTTAEFVLFSKTKLASVSVLINGKRFVGTATDANHYKVVTDIKRAGEYPVKVFDDDNLIGELTITAKGRVGKNSDDDLFGGFGQ